MPSTQGDQTDCVVFYEYGRMICLPLVLNFILLLDSVLSSLPAPVNVSVSSLNFHHVLRWDPGPGTPPGTQYRITKRVNKKAKQPAFSNTTSLKLKLPRNNVKYDLTVEAFYNQTLSPPSHKYSFTPYTDTTIGPPIFSLAGCGNCIQINISLPEPDKSSGFDDIQKYYGAKFRVFWWNHEEAVTQLAKHLKESELISNRSYTVNNLQVGTEYCLQVHTKINVNTNTEPSAWKCIFTSVLEPSRDPLVLGAVAAFLIVGVGVLMSFMFGLYYTGFLCKLKASVPRVLIGALSGGYTLTPESKICDKVSISPEMDTKRKYNNPTTSQPATRGTNSDEDEEEEEEECGNVYMDRDEELSSSESSSQSCVDLLTNSKLAAVGGSGCLTGEVDVQDTEFGDDITHEGFDQDEAKAEGADIPLMPEEPVAGEVEEDQEEVCEISGNINLFSVTLSALAVREGGEEEEEQNTGNSLPDFLKPSDLEPLLPRDSKRNLSITGLQTEPDDQTSVVVMLPTQVDFTASLYEAGCLKTYDGETEHEETEEDEEEEEEEEFSGYMAHS